MAPARAPDRAPGLPAGGTVERAFSAGRRRVARFAPAPLPRPLGHAARSTPWTRLLWGAAIGTAAMQIAGSTVGLSSATTLGLTVTSEIACVLLIVLGTRGGLPNRAGWLMVAVGLAGWVPADITYYGWILRLDPVPYPSVADAMYLAVYPVLLVGAWCICRPDHVERVAGAWLDGVMWVLATASVASAVYLGAFDRNVATPWLETLVSVSYPLIDVLTLAAVMGLTLASRRRRPFRTLSLLVAAITALTVGDIGSMFAGAGFVAGGVTDALWIVCPVLLAAAAWSDQRVQAVPSPRPARLWAPTLALSIPIAVLVLDGFLRLHPLTLVIAAAGAAVGMARLRIATSDAAKASVQRNLALTDDLTKLPNRRQFFSYLNDVLRSCDGHGVALLLVDLDRFKEVNDTLGHHEGDELLVRVADRIRSSVRVQDLPARIGGDEFAIVLGLGSDDHQAVAVAERLLFALAAPYETDRTRITIGASVGIALFPEHAVDAGSLLQFADVAMYQAKNDIRKIVVYDPERDDHTVERLELDAELHDAFERGEIVAYFQPKIRLCDDEVVGAEVLARWRHPTRGLLGAGEFLDAVRVAGYSRSLTLALLDAAADAAATWSRERFCGRIDVNFSSAEVGDERLVDDVRHALERHGIDGSLLGAEITEDVLMSDPARAERVLHELARLGIRISLDDFGTGYSSLARLSRLPVHDLKLDRWFVAHRATERRAAAIVEWSVGLARALDMQLIAEGAETEEELDALRRLGVDQVQGFVVCPPVDRRTVEHWMQARRLDALPVAGA